MADVTAELNQIVKQLEVLRPAVEHDAIDAALAAVQACLAPPKDRHVDIALHPRTARKEKIKKKLTMLFVTYIYLPAAILLSCMLVAIPLAAAESWQWRPSFDWVVAILCGMDNPVGTAGNLAPTTSSGRVFAVVVSMWALGIVGQVLNVLMNYETFPSRLTAAAVKIAGTESIRRQLVVCLLVVGVLTPAIVFAFGGIFGLILAAAEGWSAEIGIWYILGNVGALPNALVPNTPTTSGGRILDLYLSAMGFIIGSSFIGISAALPMPSPMALLLKAASAASTTSPTEKAAPVPAVSPPARRAPPGTWV